MFNSYRYYTRDYKKEIVRVSWFRIPWAEYRVCCRCGQVQDNVGSYNGQRYGWKNCPPKYVPKCLRTISGLKYISNACRHEEQTDKAEQQFQKLENKRG